MLRILAVSAEGRGLELFYPQSMILCKDETTPADSLNIIFAQIIETELAEIRVYDDDELVYHGVVDEQVVSVGKTEQTEIVSRSMAAVLLDNEACPRSFNDPGTELIFKRYIEPLGFKKYIGVDKTLHGEFRVTKGMSCYQVLEKFAKSTYEGKLRIEDDTVSFEGIDSDKALYFSNDNGLEYTRLEFRKQRCKPISCVMVKTAEVGEYSAIIRNPDAESRGITRTRYLNTAEDAYATLLTADEIIGKSKRKSESVILYTPLRLTDVLGASVVIDSDETGALTDFCVSGIRYTLGRDGESTRIILRKKES